MKHEYAGTTDLLAWVNDEFALIDLKTSGQMSLSMNMQTAAYAAAYEEEHPFGERIAKRMILRLPKDGEKFEEMSSSDPEDFEAFLWSLRLAKYWNMREKRKDRR